MARTLAEKLRYLLETVKSERGDSFTNAEVAAGTGLSPSYIGYLIRGERDNPTLQNAEALAKFFGVPVVYFTADDDAAERIDQQLERLRSMLKLKRAMQRADVEQLATRMLNLSSNGVEAIAHLVELLIDKERDTTRDAITDEVGRNPRR
ncbi:helix-turn-helix domain-containing protein [Paractinoplanes maris]|uniref:helix-turn-helix domain-containing protein n=1 Tax=Paractinoplanes maris TaxID=1734446 RepID=UPI0020218038|nr:helix-turn-helix domain-containing protein [Actinoplanes maris]